jgi:hypothetical protein
MQRLALNIGGYRGETIDIQTVLKDIDALARKRFGSRNRSSFLTPSLFRLTEKFPHTAQKHIYISAGIHGDEPAGPLAVLRLFQDNKWPAHLNLWLIPCLNPLGFVHNRRGNRDAPISIAITAPLPQTPSAHTLVAQRAPSFHIGRLFARRLGVERLLPLRNSIPICSRRSQTQLFGKSAASVR